jgi:hypothetical protein
VSSVELEDAPLNHAAADSPRDTWRERPFVVFICAFALRVIISAVFLGSCDTVNTISHFPSAAAHSYYFLPYFPIIYNITGASALVITNFHFVPVALVAKLIPCFADSLIAVWFLMDNRFDRNFGRRAAWLYVFCPLPLILVCIQGQWDSMWVLPMVSALAMADLLKHTSVARRRSLLVIGALLGIAIISKPVAVITAGLLIPNFRSRKSTNDWIQECALMLIGFAATMGLFIAKFALDDTNLHRNLVNVLAYGGTPGFTVFGPAKFYSLHALNTSDIHLTVAAVTAEFRDLSIIYVLAIVLFQIFARVPLDKMTAAAAALLICPAVGGLAPQYLFWPLVFILASGRVRAAVAYALSASSFYFLFFLVPGASAAKGESVAAYLPLRSLSFLGVPRSVLEWFANAHIVMDVWTPFADLVVPFAMCCFGLYLLLSRTRPAYALEEGELEPLRLRAIRTCIPYVAAMVVATTVYSFYRTVKLNAIYVTLDADVQKYAFIRPIFNANVWSNSLYFTTRSPWNDLVSGSWWGSILILGPLLIALWGVFACRHFSSSDALTRRDDSRQPLPSWRRVRESSR